MHQLPARHAVRECLVSPLQGFRARRARCALAGVRVREGHRERARGGREVRPRSIPIALDSDLAIWKAFNNKFWPAHYFVDAKGQIRGHHFGEGKYAKSEREIRRLLTEAGAKNLPEPLDDAAGQGVGAPADTASVASPETYLGYARAENFVSPGAFARDANKSYCDSRSR